MTLYAIYHADTGTYLAMIDHDTDRHGETVAHLGFVERIEDALQGTKAVIQETCDALDSIAPSVADGVLIVPVELTSTDPIPYRVVELPTRKRNAAGPRMDGVEGT